MKRIYIAGPYTDPDPASNTLAAIMEGHALLDLGFAPFVPHLTHYMECLQHRPYEQWLEMDFAWLRVADGVLRLPGASSGADREVALARELGIPVFESRKELAEYVWPTPPTLTRACRS
jgi:hypothetical protein